jgi:hypothetical protein
VSIQEAVEALRAGKAHWLVRHDPDCLIIITPWRLGLQVHLEWRDDPPEEQFFLEENQFLLWWQGFVRRSSR